MYIHTIAQGGPQGRRGPQGSSARAERALDSSIYIYIYVYLYNGLHGFEAFGLSEISWLAGGGWVGRAKRATARGSERSCLDRLTNHN